MTTVERHSTDLDGVVEQVARAHGYDVVTVTDEGKPVAVVMSPEEWWSIRETLDIVTTPGAAAALDEGIEDLDQGREVDGPALLKHLTARLKN